MSSKSRTFTTPSGYGLTPGGRVAQMNQCYLGYVKENTDAFKMGRLKVWIPEFCSNPDDSGNWLTVQYCSPFAGATSYKKNVKQGTSLGDTQQSYGWWAVPPDLENEVIVMFINGDPNRGIYIGGLYQQFMNHMVPGIPPGVSNQAGTNGINPPVAEYNRWDPSLTASGDHPRARFDPLHVGLSAQGLYDDAIRGPYDSGARRASVSKVYGFKSPNGHHMVFDDGDEQEFIRFRTKTGTQVLINDTVGYVYIISGNGNSWFEISDDGIDGYSSKSINLRSNGDINFHADGSMNLHSNNAMNIYSEGSGAVKFGANLDLVVGSKTNVSVGSDLNLSITGSANIKSSANISLQANGTMATKTGGALSINSAGNICLTAPAIMQNGDLGPKPTDPGTAKGPTVSGKPDIELSGTGNQLSTNSITSRMPSHEPWSGHPETKSAASRVSSGFGAGGLSGTSSGVSVVGTGDEFDDSPAVVIPDDGTKFAMPTSCRRVSCLFGKRRAPTSGASSFHQGVDMASPIGTPIYATKGGRVTHAGSGGGYGVYIEIDHGNGISSRYGHLSYIGVTVGQTVKQMQPIGKMGNAGVSTGPHLHFEVRKNGVAFNPQQVLPITLNQPTTAGTQLK